MLLKIPDSRALINKLTKAIISTGNNILNIWSFICCWGYKVRTYIESIKRLKLKQDTHRQVVEDTETRRPSRRDWLLGVRTRKYASRLTTRPRAASSRKPATATERYSPTSNWITSPFRTRHTYARQGASFRTMTYDAKVKRELRLNAVTQRCSARRHRCATM